METDQSGETDRPEESRGMESGSAGERENFMNDYRPNPMDTSDVTLSEELLAITEKLAENVHENWAKARMEQGWTYGPVRDEASRTTPCLVPYGDLTEEEKEYDRRTALETVRQILKLGYNIQPKEGT